MRRVTVQFADAKELETFDKVMKQHMPSAKYRIPMRIARPPVERERARDFLLDVLADGPQFLTKLERMATKEGLVWSTVKRAKKVLPISSVYTGRQVEWQLRSKR